MTGSIERRIAVGTCQLLCWLAPSSLRVWAQALSSEVTSIASDRTALKFVTASFGPLLLQIIAAHLKQLIGATPDLPPAAKDAFRGRHGERNTFNVQAFAMITALASTSLGLIYLASANAPLAFLCVNAGALVIGLCVLMLASGRGTALLGWHGPIMLALAMAILATAIFGVRVEGAARWTRVAGVALQPGLIIVPMLTMIFVRHRGRALTTAVCIAAIALALQPDRALSGMLLAGVAVSTIMRPDRPGFVGFSVSALAFIVTLARPDALPATAFVDRVYDTAFDVNLIAGLSVLIGSALLIGPSIIGVLIDPANRDQYLAFAAIWLTAITAAGLGSYPTPVVGYSGAAILGYVFSLWGLPRQRSEATRRNIGRSFKKPPNSCPPRSDRQEPAVVQWNDVRSYHIRSPL
jgi:hypothetical protein